MTEALSSQFGTGHHHFSKMPFPTIGDLPWQREQINRIVGLFRDTHLEARAVLMARSHRHAADLILQAPAIVVMVSGDHKVNWEKRLIAKTLHFAEEVRRPRDIMISLELAPALRALTATALISSDKNTLLALSRLNPSTLAQAIPAPEGQSLWLMACRSWRERMERAGAPADLLFDWMAASVSRSAAFTQWREVADLALHLRGRFVTRWSWEKAYSEAEAWHRELAKNKQNASFFRSHGREFDEPLDYGDLPIEEQVLGHHIVALRSGEDLYEDGRAMHHCVSSYAGEVISGRSRIFSIRFGEKRVATVELKQAKKRWTIEQLKGPCNRPVIPAIESVAKDFVALCNQPPQSKVIG
ncbi:PcfJ domain-containing protein [Bosea sp. SSUT16]|uniref:PcfJ domain-containing protein n=1 Tax=Bosea spartocytisi TaxID=2773451 RepID=A0A927E724_9HYPH|nr:PcfJ domain-containing protein [Bosea spartocytisi]MBD3845973.1 PcfJ domain-containing protein [Bosea spartocytisi]MCT4473157.1 PcfJ domain-containing protein [Bosea spartocytisi]